MQVNKRKENTFLCVVASLLLSGVLGTSLAFAGLLPLSLAHEAPGHQDFQMPSAHAFPLDSYFLFKIRISLNFRCSHSVTILQWVPPCSLSRISEGIARRNCVPFLFPVESNCVPPLSTASRKPQASFILLSIFHHFFLFNFSLLLCSRTKAGVLGRERNHLWSSQSSNTQQNLSCVTLVVSETHKCHTQTAKTYSCVPWPVLCVSPAFLVKNVRVPFLFLWWKK